MDLNRIISLAAALATFFAIPSASAGYLRELCQPGASYPIAVSNNYGDSLVTWEQVELPVKEGICEHATSRAAIISSNNGVIPLGTVPSGGDLSFSAGAYIDGVGDVWIVGLHGEVGYGKYGANYGRYGPWLSFLPVGGVFRGPLELPTRHGRSESVVVAGNQHGHVLIAWGVSRGTYIAWVDDGSLSRITYIDGDFHVAGMGVDEEGQAVVVGYYPGKQSYTASAIGVVTSTIHGNFSKPKIIARPPRRFFRGKRHGTLGLPVVGVGSSGDVFIAYEALWEEPRSGAELEESTDMVVHRLAKGKFSIPKPFADGFLDLPIGPATYPSNDEAPEPPSITVDGAGRAAIVSSRHTTVEEIFFRSNGRPSHRVRLGRAPYAQEISIAGNADGRTIVTWVNDQNTLTAVVGDTNGHHGHSRHIPTPRKTYSGDGPVSAVNGEGLASVSWIEGATFNDNIINVLTLRPGASTISISG